jgi:BirA family biotin operon repressor/biotin-[acetyl-CoA-carboxylase] ligase
MGADVLPGSGAALDADEVSRLLTTRYIGRPLYYLPETGSTNDDAARLAEHRAPEGTAVVADWQSAGRGRHGRRWVAPPRAALLFSIVLRPRLAPAQVFRVTAAGALAVLDAVRATGACVQLKWPNDVVCEGQKLAGLLAQAGWRDSLLSWLVLGIGLNVNVPAQVLAGVGQPATSLLVELGTPVPREPLLAGVLNRFEPWYEAALGAGWPQVLARWRADCALLGHPVQIRTVQGIVAGVALDVDEQGALLLQGEDGRIVRFLEGDVSIRGR